jgi:hypothetical protein
MSSEGSSADPACHSARRAAAGARHLARGRVLGGEKGAQARNSPRWRLWVGSDRAYVCPAAAPGRLEGAAWGRPAARRAARRRPPAPPLRPLAPGPARPWRPCVRPRACGATAHAAACRRRGCGACLGRAAPGGQGAQTPRDPTSSPALTAGARPPALAPHAPRAGTRAGLAPRRRAAPARARPALPPISCSSPHPARPHAASDRSVRRRRGPRPAPDPPGSTAGPRRRAQRWREAAGGAALAQRTGRPAAPAQHRARKRPGAARPPRRPRPRPRTQLRDRRDARHPRDPHHRPQRPLSTLSRPPPCPPWPDRQRTPIRTARSHAGRPRLHGRSGASAAASRAGARGVPTGRGAGPVARPLHQHSGGEVRGATDQPRGLASRGAGGAGRADGGAAPPKGVCARAPHRASTRPRRQRRGAAAPRWAPPIAASVLVPRSHAPRRWLHGSPPPPLRAQWAPPPTTRRPPPPPAPPTAQALRALAAAAAGQRVQRQQPGQRAGRPRAPAAGLLIGGCR